MWNLSTRRLLSSPPFTSITDREGILPPPFQFIPFFPFKFSTQFCGRRLLSQTYLGSSTEPSPLTLPSAEFEEHARRLAVGCRVPALMFADTHAHAHGAHAALFNSVQVHFDKAPLEWPCLTISPHQSPRTENKREITCERPRRRSVMSRPADGSGAICMQGGAVACDWVIRAAGAKSRDRRRRMIKELMTPL